MLFTGARCLFAACVALSESQQVPGSLASDLSAWERRFISLPESPQAQGSTGLVCWRSSVVSSEPVSTGFLNKVLKHTLRLRSERLVHPASLSITQLEILGTGMVGGALLLFRHLLPPQGLRAVFADCPVWHSTLSSLAPLPISSENLSLPDLFFIYSPIVCLSH